MDAIEKLREIVIQLRGPDGCPWDKEQTFESLIPHIIEEAYELVDAIETGVPTAIQEELGDVLLHVVMLAEMAAEQNHFKLPNVAEMVTEKMIRRHPHVFGDTQVSSVDEIWKNWEAIKAKEKTQGPFESIPRSLPALIKAAKIQKKAGRMGVIQPNLVTSMAKLESTLAQLKTTSESSSDRHTQLAGNALFQLVSICRNLDIDPESALNTASTAYTTEIESGILD